MSICSSLPIQKERSEGAAKPLEYLELESTKPQASSRGSTARAMSCVKFPRSAAVNVLGFDGECPNLIP